MISIEITKPLGVVLFDSAFPRNDFETRQQKVNNDGVPMWSVNLILRQPDSRRSENLTVNVPSVKDPTEIFDPFAPVSFSGLRIMTGENNGNTWVSFGADGIAPAGAAAPKSDNPTK
ncbi:hypothetical protein [Adlercreutzia mucosicola]|uniref:hypothetical protein n=1 Tax=Adlercreutzia mucosicola TaxID=580026 RepID=UPI002B25092F|nr:hypothetical protein [Adlercreutzia mucosicola]MEB1814003.1 hypothetical protein [Adlercreutzia mucosicola]